MKRLPQWLWVLIIGVVLWLVAAGVAIATQNIIIVPEVLMLGGFVVPTALLFWILERITPGPAPAPRTALDAPRVLAAFALGGGLGLLASAVIEDYWTSAWPRVFFFDVAVTEELVKFGAVWLLALPLVMYLRRDGMLLGAAVGLGFSAFESTGYAFNVLVTERVMHTDVLTTQAVRGVLTPVGHALWTALVAGALFAAARSGDTPGGRAVARGRLRLTWSVVGWLALACGLHALWDISRGIGASIIVWREGGRVNRDLLLGTAYQSLATTEGSTIELISGVVQTLIAVAGVVLFVRYWRLAGSAERRASPTAE